MSTTLETPTAEISYEPLNAHDRCDRCGAQAFMRWGKGAVDLITCAHHGNKYEADLIAQGFDVVQDDRDKLNVKPSPSANV